MAEESKDPEDKSLVLARLACGLARRGQLDRAKKALQEAHQQALLIPIDNFDGLSQALGLVPIAVAEYKINGFESGKNTVLEIARMKIPNDPGHMKALSRVREAFYQILLAQLERGDRKKAWVVGEVLLQRGGGLFTTAALKEIAIDHANHGEIKEAFEALDKLQAAEGNSSAFWVVQALARISVCQKKFQGLEAASATLVKAAKIVDETIASKELQHTLLVDLAIATAELRGVPEGIKLLEDERVSLSPKLVARGMLRFAEIQLKGDDRKGAEATLNKCLARARAVSDESEQHMLLRDLTRLLAQTGLAETADKWTAQLPKPVQRAHAYVGIAEGLVARILEKTK